MDAARRRRLVGPTGDWEQLEPLCFWPEQRDYELIRPLVLFGSPAAEHAGETRAASERTLQRRVALFEAVRSIIRTCREEVRYRNSALATAIKKIRRSCHNRFPTGVLMSKPRETLEDTWPATPGSRRPN
jgi:hypothetical protein